MPSLNIRNIGNTLVQRLKSEAALKGKTLREYVIEKLENGNGGVSGVRVSAEVPKAGGRKPVAVGNAGDAAFVDITKMPKTCKHGEKKGYNCWQCGGIAQVNE
jgi:hypothetical protein